MKYSWGTLEPKTVAEYINFDPKNNPHGSFPASGTMAAKQTEGAAFLWNTLHEQGIALLADEVGMGKTFQALAVCCLLWRSNPNARVMVMTPNGSICQHWDKEYRAFVKEHYSQVDLLVKTAANHEPVHDAKFCSHLRDLCDEPFASHQFILTKISSLSYLTQSADKDDDLCALAELEAIKIRETLKQQSKTETPFDLVIIDEAQYFRTYGTKSQKHHAAQGFFGEKDGNPLSDKFLLLTATPSHRSMDDVQNIMRYFSFELAKLSPSSILERVALRRLRLLQTKTRGAFNKYQYREERPLPADFSGDVDAELFYALYQKKLVQNSKGSSGRGYMYGYLEGFESLGRHEPETMATQDDARNPAEGKAEYYQADDSEILAILSRQYHAYYSHVPSHPKYRALVSELVHTSGYWDEHRCLLEDKHLVFVRRIPSVNELTQRVNEVYEKLFAERIMSALLVSNATQQMMDEKLQKWQKDNYSRKSYADLFRECRGSAGSPDEADEDDVIEPADSEAEDEPSGYKCRVLDIFTTKKDKGQDATHASRFRLRFGKETDPFVIFFEPALDYQYGDYPDFISKQGKKEYRKYARSTRRDLLNAKTAMAVLEDFEPYGIGSTLDGRSLPTLWSLCVKVLPTQNPDLQKVLDGLSIEEKESFSRYLRAGLLFASSALIELYAWYIEAAGSRESRPTYEQYVTYVGNHLVESVTYRLWCEALTTFQTYLNKIRGVAGKHLLDEHIWNCFTRPPQQPAWFVSGSTAPGARESIRVAFNSPFFPNVLIATSVFQEGVNLHLNCRKVNHYGMAASAGDNEQRIGRVDRLFGHINRKMEEQQHDRLLISYPYLKGTFDEEQLASFLRTKDVIVSKMDECRQPEAEKYIQQTTGDDWTRFLHTPERFIDHTTTDPFPAGDGRKNWAGWPVVTYQPYSAIEPPPFSSVAQDVELACKHIPNVVARIFHYSQEGPRWLFIDVQRTHVSRQQPVVVEKHFNPTLQKLGSGGYFLRLKSPLVNQKDVDVVETLLLPAFKRLSVRYPLPKLMLDDRHEGWFHLHLAVDLPLLMKDGQTLLAKEEIQFAFEQLIHLTDELELTIFNDFDLKKECIVEMSQLGTSPEGTSHSSRVPEQHKLADGWQSLTVEDQGEKHSLVFRNLEQLFTGDWHTCAAANHNTPFINHLLFGEENHVGICFPTVDFQPEEQTLLTQVCEGMVALERLTENPNPSIQAIVTLFALLTGNTDLKIARTVWNQSYRRFGSVAEDMLPTRQSMKTLIEAIAAELEQNVTVSIPFWRGGWASRNDLFGIFDSIAEWKGIIGLTLIHYNDGNEPYSAWEVIRKMTDSNLLLARLKDNNSLKREQLRLDSIMVRNDHAELTANASRPYQIRPTEGLLIELGIT